MEFDFRAGKSAAQIMQYLVSQIINSFEKKEFLHATLFNLSKAFDTITHEMEIDKLHHHGVWSVELELLCLYLKDRKQIDGSYSEIFEIIHDVPPRSILGPFLFIIVINDLAANLQFKPVIYADETTLVNSGCDAYSLILY